MAGRDRLARRLLMSGVVPRQRPRPSLHGYTLVELMVAVAIVGILATLATYGVRKYLLAAKSAEPIEIINSIRASQESYKDETFKYLDVSSGVIDSYFPFDNANEMKGKAKSWLAGGDAILQGWDELGVRPSAAVQFGYACVAKDGQTPPSATDLRVEKSPLPASPSGWWYVVRAVGDRDGDGELSSFIGSSFTDHIYYESDTE
jgi:prepilin-type N-terminal cleavage/methylation domain-containing protein